MMLRVLFKATGNRHSPPGGKSANYSKPSVYPSVWMKTEHVTVALSEKIWKIARVRTVSVYFAITMCIFTSVNLVSTRSSKIDEFSCISFLFTAAYLALTVG